MSEPCRMPCHRCIKEFKITAGYNTGHGLLHALPLSSAQMIVCRYCGNKRCPHASDHRLACTGSNEPGQEGSVYQ